MKMSSASRTTVEKKVLERVFDPLGQCLTPQVARRIVALRADFELQARVDELAHKSNAGLISARERAEYKAHIDAIHFMTILQSRARRLLAQASS